MCGNPLAPIRAHLEAPLRRQLQHVLHRIGECAAIPGLAQDAIVTIFDYSAASGYVGGYHR
jgi:hypothetical protein